MTPRQKDALDFIASYIAARGFSPSYAEIAGGLGLANKSGVHRLTHGLANKGLITFERGDARSIRLVDPSAASDPAKIRRAALIEAAEIAVGYGRQGQRAAEAIRSLALVSP